MSGKEGEVVQADKSFMGMPVSYSHHPVIIDAHLSRWTTSGRY